MELKRDLVPPVADLLDWLEPVMVPPLFPPSSGAALRSLARALPAARLLLFECHLGGAGQGVDLSLGQTIAFPLHLDLPILQAHPGPILFEYDQGLEAHPAVFASFSHRARADGARLAGLASALLGPVSPEIAAMLDRAAEVQEPASAWITQFGAMLSRAHQPIRLNIGGRSRAAIRCYAGLIGLSPESLGLLDGMFDVATGLDAEFILAVDVAERVLPRIGLEVYFEDNGGSDQFLDRLRVRGLCDDEEIAGIALWNGSGRVSRRLNHVKLVASSPGDLRAKAYLAAHYAGAQAA
jgi:hypothetical protein